MKISERALDVINDLVEIVNDRAAGFEKASSDLENDESGLKNAFTRFANASRQYVEELGEIALQSGGDIAEGTSTAGDLQHRTGKQPGSIIFKAA